MYAGAIVPGLVLTGLSMGYVLLMSIIWPNSMPALPPEARTLGSGVMSLVVALVIAVAVAYGANRILIPHYGQNADIWGATIGIIVIYVAAILDKGLKIGLMSRLAQQVVIVLIPPLALIFLVLGTIFLGIATPTEGGAMGAVGALVMAAAKGRLSVDVVRQALTSTTRLSSFVLFILIGARTFSLTFYGVNGHLWVEHLLLAVPGGETGFLIVVNILVFVLAFFLDFFELAFILIPLLAPVADKLGIDLIWFGVLLGVNMQTSFMHPPFGFALFYLRSVAARVPYLDKVTGKKIEPITTGQIYWGAVPFVVIQVLMIGLTIAFPQMVMRYKGDAVQQDIKNIHIQVPGLGGDGMGFNPFAAPGSSGNTQAPGLGGTPPGLGGTPPGLGGSAGTPKPATPPPATDLSQPPKFN
jgi:TRAP-type mannitol/chloroaromatic compound transport system permease large subunit